MIPCIRSLRFGSVYVMEFLSLGAKTSIVSCERLVPGATASNFCGKNLVVLCA